jgi:parvulin-like peptidyl-prolyl isomerase
MRTRSQSRWTLFPLVFLVSVAFHSCSLPDETAAEVNGLAIATAELESAYEQTLAQFGEMVPPGAEESRRIRLALLDRLIERELMLQEAANRGLLPTEEEIAATVRQLQGGLQERDFKAVLEEAGLERSQWTERIAEDLSLEKLQEEVVYPDVKVSDEELADYTRRHRGDGEERTAEEIRASQILVRTREEAVKAKKRIKGGEDFASVAGEVSLSPDGERGGDLGYFSRGQMPQEFDAVVFNLKTGKLSEVVETTYGYHLFLVTDRRDAHQKSDEEVREGLRRILLTKKREKAFRSWVVALRESAQIRYNENILSP